MFLAQNTDIDIAWGKHLHTKSIEYNEFKIIEKESNERLEMAYFPGEASMNIT